MKTPDFDLRHYVESLPQPHARQTLFDAIVQAHARRRARRSAMVGALGILAVVALAGTWLPRKAETPSPPRAVATRDAELRAVDRALQSAYERGAADAEIAPLWSRRDALHRGADAPLPLKL